jgi:hypothetical protein
LDRQEEQPQIQRKNEDSAYKSHGVGNSAKLPLVKIGFGDGSGTTGNQSIHLLIELIQNMEIHNCLTYM